MEASQREGQEGQVQDLNIAHERSPHGRITASLGLACMVPQAETPSTAITQAVGEAVGKARNASGNQIVVAQDGD